MEGREPFQLASHIQPEQNKHVHTTALEARSHSRGHITDLHNKLHIAQSFFLWSDESREGREQMTGKEESNLSFFKGRGPQAI